MFKRSNNQTRRVNQVLEQVIWEGYITFIRLPIHLRTSAPIQLQMVKMREALALSVKNSEEQIQNKAEEIATKLGVIS